MIEPNDSRPRILVIASTYPRWEGDHEPGFVHELLRRMTGDFSIALLTSSSPGASHHEVMDGVEVHRYRYAPRRMETLVYGGGILTHLRRAKWKWLLVPFFLTAQLLATRRLIRCTQPAIVHAHWAIPQAVLAAWALAFSTRRIPLVVTSHGSDIFGFRNSLFARLRSYVGHRAAAWTVVGSALSERLMAEHAVPAMTKPLVMPMGVDLTHTFTPTGASRKPGLILAVGRLVPGKGHEVLLDALPHVRARFPTARLLVAGDGPMRSILQRRAEMLGVAEHVEFRGSLANAQLPELYRTAALHAAPFTVLQGFGLTLIEAIGCGCPVVTTDLASVRDIAADVGLVRLVTPGDIDSLCDAICDVLLKPPSPHETDMAVGALRARHDWSAVARDHSNLYQRILDSQGADGAA